jgi:hypothetical protein
MPTHIRSKTLRFSGSHDLSHTALCQCYPHYGVPRLGYARADTLAPVLCEEPDPVSSISWSHWVERDTSEAIKGQVSRIPGGICAECQLRFLRCEQKDAASA